MEKVVIVGAGVAGLSCMNALLDRGIQPHLFDAGRVGSEKLCGEFLSPEAVLQLEAWGIGPIQKIQDIALSSKMASLNIKQAAGAMSRSDAELQLAKRAKALGGEIFENTKIEKIAPGELILSDGRCIQPKQLIIATGRIGTPPKQFPYMGLKAHFLHDTLAPRLEMRLFKGGYFGIVPISATTSNITCLVKASCYNQAFIEMNRKLPYLSSQVAPFGLKKPPQWPNSYWIGDAIASLPPAIGQGFGHAINSAIEASRFLLANDPTGYRRSLERSLLPKMRWAKLIHHAMLTPTASHIALSLLQKSPQITERLMRSIME